MNDSEPCDGPKSGNKPLALHKMYDGEDFFKDWNFWNQKDPTNGHVNYVNESTARNDGLISVKDGTITIAVDDKTRLNGEPRKSVRIATKEKYNKGLYILDAVGPYPFRNEMPCAQQLHSNAVWVLRLASLVDRWRKLAKWR
jgi:hypothetical protein